MCLIALALGVHPRWPLVIASNRDEYLTRPTDPLATWSTPSGQTVFGGRDLQDGGTWFGLTPQGRVALLTNERRGSARSGPKSRGELVTRWLESDLDAVAFAATLRPGDYAGFNLLVGDQVRGAWHCLAPGEVKDAVDGVAVSPVSPGVHGLSNARLNTPWPKTAALTQSMVTALDRSQHAEELQQALFQALNNRTRYPVDQLPQTGVPIDMEWGLSSVWVDLPERNYGTRSSAVLVAEAAAGAQAVTVWEHTHRTSPPRVAKLQTQWAAAAEGQRLSASAIATCGMPASSNVAPSATNP